MVVFMLHVIPDVLSSATIMLRRRREYYVSVQVFLAPWGLQARTLQARQLRSVFMPVFDLELPAQSILSSSPMRCTSGCRFWMLPSASAWILCKNVLIKMGNLLPRILYAKCTSFFVFAEASRHGLEADAWSPVILTADQSRDCHQRQLFIKDSPSRRSHLRPTVQRQKFR